MSGVERKKKMKSMKQKIKRSSSASRVESGTSNKRGGDSGGTRTPPARLSPRSPEKTSRESSQEFDNQRKVIIAEKVAELKRIRDLAKAYAEGGMDGGSVQRPTASIQPSEIAVIQEKFKRSRSKLEEKRFDKPEFIVDDKGVLRVEVPLEKTRKQRVVENEILRATNVSRYDNTSPNQLDSVPKFPTCISRHTEDTATLYDNKSRSHTPPTQYRGGGGGDKTLAHQVNDDIEALVCAINSSSHFWDRDVDEANNVLLDNAVANNCGDELTEVDSQLTELDAHLYVHVSNDSHSQCESPNDGLVCYAHVLECNEHADLHEAHSQSFVGSMHDDEIKLYLKPAILAVSPQSLSRASTSFQSLVSDITRPDLYSDSTLSLSNISIQSSLTSDTRNLLDIELYERGERSVCVSWYLTDDRT